MAGTTNRKAKHEDDEPVMVLLDNVHRFGEVFAKGTLAEDLPEHARMAFEAQGGLIGPLSDLT